MEKQKNLDKIKSEKEIINEENEEKRKLMITIEKYYKDQIKMLREENQKHTSLIPLCASQLLQNPAFRRCASSRSSRSTTGPARP